MAKGPPQRPSGEGRVCRHRDLDLEPDGSMAEGRSRAWSDAEVGDYPGAPRTPKSDDLAVAMGELAHRIAEDGAGLRCGLIQAMVVLTEGMT